MNTRISYLYRDAGNYKMLNEVVISGFITWHQIDIIMDCLDEGGYFIPKQVGLPESRCQYCKSKSCGQKEKAELISTWNEVIMVAKTVMHIDEFEGRCGYAYRHEPFCNGGHNCRHPEALHETVMEKKLDTATLFRVRGLYVQTIRISRRLGRIRRNTKKICTWFCLKNKRKEAQVKKRYVNIAGVRYEILKRMWRICINPRCNDWNDEPEHIAVPYEILEEREKSYVCIRAGWHQKNVLAKREFFESRELCESEICRKWSYGECARKGW